ncbi:hypothetical protein BDV28DRAFT_141288 [Aspergillus coremiiformis]|uniref:Uncharacterized protein n=1 Tax=Aspergillus coremiiformis TaxID=138285 RepID=A0A5N6YV93_9EURO|nr:hypothetical protein BDV28DRAFT_141288 [Aspergillus coremiiformis]
MISYREIHSILRLFFSLLFSPNPIMTILYTVVLDLLGCRSVRTASLLSCPVLHPELRHPPRMVLSNLKV